MSPLDAEANTIAVLLIAQVDGTGHSGSAGRVTQTLRSESGTGVLLAGAAVAAWMLRDVLFILFGALVLAIGVNALAKFLTLRIRIGYRVAFSIVVLLGLAIIGAIGCVFIVDGIG